MYFDTYLATTMQSTINAILLSAGIIAQQIDTLHGGDINQSFRVTHADGKLFIKINSAQKFPDMLLQESEGLASLGAANCLHVPKVVCQGVDGDYQYLLLEWLEPSIASKGYWQNLGCGLAKQHRLSALDFGWGASNYIGSLPQINSYNNNWISFYINNRLMPLIKKLVDAKDFSSINVLDVESFYKQLPALLPTEPPALLHGDLWSGNCMPIANDAAAVYDPAVYYGHREMDIAMTALFGGFQPTFYTAYEEIYPLEKGWQNRLPIMQLYPLLVHAVLFGGGYISKCKDIIKRYV